MGIQLEIFQLCVLHGLDYELSCIQCFYDVGAQGALDCMRSLSLKY